MDFVAKEIFYFFWFSLTLGAFGKIKQSPNNKVASDGATDASMSCKSSSDAKLIKWSFTPVGSTAETKIIKNVDSITVTDDAFLGEVEKDGKTYDLNIKTASASTAGTYTCDETDTKSAVLIVTKLTCDYSPRPTKTLPCDSTLTLSCTMTYIADSTFVSVVLTWTQKIDKATSADQVTGMSFLEGQQTPPSTSGIITTTTSTVNVTLPTVPTDGGEMPKYTCDAIFTVKTSAKWPTMDQNEPPYNHGCQPFASASSVPCGGKDDPSMTTVTGEKGEQSKDSSVRSAETNNLAIRVLGVAGVLLLAQVL